MGKKKVGKIAKNEQKWAKKNPKWAILEHKKPTFLEQKGRPFYPNLKET